MTNPFNCPQGIYSAMQSHSGPLLVAAERLGPARMQWIGSPTRGYGLNRKDMPTCWALDGKRATYEEIMAAANLR